jgi:hypothetical protein
MQSKIGENRRPKVREKREEEENGRARTLGTPTRLPRLRTLPVRCSLQTDTALERKRRARKKCQFGHFARR